MDNSAGIMKAAGSRVYCRSAMVVFLVLLLGIAGCEEPSPWVQVSPDEKVYGMLDIPLRRLHEETEDYIGVVFEDQFKFYRIYHDKEDADPAVRGQVILGETHFTARPVHQYLHAIQIQITPRQEAWIRAQGIERQDAIRARVRFTGIAPGAALAFELLEILDVPRHKRSL
jgi:hypothetical protein